MSKARTIGDAINELIVKHGTTRQGIYILSQALAGAVGKRGSYVTVQGKLPHQYPRYKFFRDREKREMEEIGRRMEGIKQGLAQTEEGIQVLKEVVADKVQSC